jgi:hypothetical protein
MSTKRFFRGGGSQIKPGSMHKSEEQSSANETSPRRVQERRETLLEESTEEKLFYESHFKEKERQIEGSGQ